MRRACKRLDRLPRAEKCYELAGSWLCKKVATRGGDRINVLPNRDCYVRPGFAMQRLRSMHTWDVRWRERW